MTDNSIPQKRCTKCGETFPATLEYFYKYRTSRDGLMSICKTCKRAYKVQRYNSNPERHRAYSRQYHHEHRDERHAYLRRWLKDNPDKKREIDKRWRENNRDRKRANSKAWREANAEKVRAKARDRYWRDVERSRDYFKKKSRKPKYIAWRRKYNRNYYQLNREKKAAYAREYRAANPGKVTQIYQRRRARENNLVSDFTPQEWVLCLDWWNHTCAYCGCQRSFWHTLEQDHVVPVNKGGGYTAANIVPCCRSCNSSKNNTDLETWLHGRYSKRKATQITERVYEYLNQFK